LATEEEEMTHSSEIQLTMSIQLFERKKLTLSGAFYKELIEDNLILVLAWLLQQFLKTLRRQWDFSKKIILMISEEGFSTLAELSQRWVMQSKPVPIWSLRLMKLIEWANYLGSQNQLITKNINLWWSTAWKYSLGYMLLLNSIRDTLSQLDRILE